LNLFSIAFKKIEIRCRYRSLNRSSEIETTWIRLAIATTTSPENVTALVGSTLGRDACGWFDVIGAGDVVKSKKPDPAIYHWVLERLGLAGHTCLAIEDSHNGLVAARAAEIPVLITRSFYCSAEDFTGAAAVINNFDGTSDSVATQKRRLRDPVNVEQLRRWAATRHIFTLPRPAAENRRLCSA
jgi:beta-phosphoglucomutase-like phosphatase (HAD superfamily)